MPAEPVNASCTCPRPVQCVIRGLKQTIAPVCKPQEGHQVALNMLMRQVLHECVATYSPPRELTYSQKVPK